MRVKIEEIQTPGLERSEPLGAEVVDEALSDSAGFTRVSTGTLKASFKKLSGRVHVRGSFSVTLSAPCKRCLKDQNLELPVEFSLRMIEESRQDDEDVVEGEVGAETGRRRKKSKKDDDEVAERSASFELDEIDAEPFDGKTIDVDPIVREQLLLALPLSVLCKDDCKGLCTTCGADLNQGDCGHGQVREVDGRLAKLKDIKLN